jgi:hypothetical protein
MMSSRAVFIFLVRQRRNADRDFSRFTALAQGAVMRDTWDN